MTNLQGQQVLKDKHNSYNAKSLNDSTVGRMKAFVGMKIYIYLCVRLSYHDYG